MKSLAVAVICFLSFGAIAQFDGAAGTSGSLAIYKDSSAIVGWANYCQVTRGWLDISDKSQGLASHGLDVYGTGYADGTEVVSLGDSGVATLIFNPSIANGPGPDFAVFENSFADNFLELAFVEVSSNGVDFYRFPATSNYPDTSQIGPFDAISDPSTLNNLAGKYRGGFGTPFDLNELDSIPELNLNQITHVRIIDAIGSVDPNFGSQDINGNWINDPFPTPFPSSGFDLDGVAVLHPGPLNIAENQGNSIQIFPNPLNAGSTLNFTTQENISSIQVIAVDGSLIFEGLPNEFNSERMNSGTYLVQIQSATQLLTHRLIIR